MAEYEYRTLTAHYNSHGKRYFDDITYWWMSEKLVLSLLNKEGWELLIVTPIEVTPTAINITEEIKRYKSKNCFYYWFPWFKKRRDNLIKTGRFGEAYIFCRPKLE